MNREAIPIVDTIPIPEVRRQSTDVCCTVVGALIALIMFILAIIFFSSNGVNNAFFNSTDAGYNSDYSGFKAAFWWTVLAAFSLGLLWLVITHCCPRSAPIIAIVLGVITLIALGVLILLTRSNFFGYNGGWKIIVAVVAFILAIILIVMAACYSNALKMQGIFLDYARRCLLECASAFLYIPLFLLFLFLLILLFIFQHLAFSSKWVTNGNYWNYSASGFFGVLNVLEFIWGFQFLRDAFNFCVSGVATDWYWNNYSGVVNSSGQYTATSWTTPLKRLFTRHWGSVVAGSFLNAFFELPTLVLQLFTCHSNTCCHKIGQIHDKKCCCGFLFDLVRTDTYSYINLSGQPYCNSARECAFNCARGQQWVGSYNTLKHYRFAASVFLTALSYLLGHFFANWRLVSYTWWQSVTLVVISYAIICWFVNIYADAAEGISTSFLAEYRYAGDYPYMQQAIASYRNEIQQRSQVQLRSNGTVGPRDGNC